MNWFRDNLVGRNATVIFAGGASCYRMESPGERRPLLK